MFERFSRGWSLAVESWRVLRADKRLVVFPMLSGLSMLLVLAAFAVPLWNMPAFRELLQRDGPRQLRSEPLAYVVLFLFYFVNYFVIVFFNSGLLTCAILRLRGETPTLGDGFRASLARLPQIAGWALVSATVGVVLKAVESRSEKLGRVLTALFGAAWSVVTFLVVPVLVVEKAGPIEAVKRSAALLKRTWGESLAGHLGTNVIGLVVLLVALVPLVLLGAMAVFCFAGQAPLLGIAAVAGCVAVVTAAVLISSTLSVILQAAIYVYAAQGEAPAAFGVESLRDAFRTK